MGLIDGSVTLTEALVLIFGTLFAWVFLLAVINGEKDGKEEGE